MRDKPASSEERRASGSGPIFSWSYTALYRTHCALEKRRCASTAQLSGSSGPGEMNRREMCSSSQNMPLEEHSLCIALPQSTNHLSMKIYEKAPHYSWLELEIGVFKITIKMSNRARLSVIDSMCTLADYWLWQINVLKPRIDVLLGLVFFFVCQVSVSMGKHELTAPNV